MSEKVLIIDDDVDFLECARLALEKGGHVVLTAGDAKQGVELARMHRPTVVVVDLLMSPESGFAACQNLRSQPDTRDAAIVVVSAIGQKLHKRFDSPDVGGQLDADAYLEKPVALETLAATVDEVARRRRSVLRSSRERSGHSCSGDDS